MDAMEKYEAIDPDLRDAIEDRFNLEVTSRITRSGAIGRLPDHDRFSLCPTIVPFVVLRQDGSPASLVETIRVHQAMREPGSTPPVHLGQAVALGRHNVLRICASMQHIDDVASLFVEHQSLAGAFAPFLQDLDLLFSKLEHVLAEHRTGHDSAG